MLLTAVAGEFPIALRRAQCGPLGRRIREAPQEYAFVREIAPVTVDIGDGDTPGVTIIAGSSGIPSTSHYQLPPFKCADLPNFSEFQALFATFKITKIEVIMVPMWQNTVNPDGVGSGTTQVPNVMVTRVGTRFLPEGYALSTTAEASRDKLAQINRKAGACTVTKMAKDDNLPPSGLSDSSSG